MPTPKIIKKKRKVAKLNRIEKAFLYIAGMMEDPVHDQYMIKAHILDILGLEEVKGRSNKKK